MLFLTILQQQSAVVAALLQRSILFEPYQRMRCLWCWPQRHPNQPYPYRSSHMCKECREIQMAQLVARRRARAASNKEVLA